MFKRIVLLLALSMFASAASADGATGPGVINAVQLYEQHTGVLIRHTNQMDPDHCGSSAWFILPNTHPQYKEIYALALTARVGGQSVLIFVGGCLQGYPAIHHIVM